MSAEIYWRRRLLVLAGLILIAWIVVRLWPSSEEPTAKPTIVASTQPQTATTPVASPDVPATDGVRTVHLSSSENNCDPQQIRVTPTIPSGQLIGDPVSIDLVVSSEEDSACTLTPEKAALLVVISSGGTAIYDSTVCKTSLLNEPVSISPNWATVVKTQWSGRGSGPDCSSKEGFAAPGTYQLQVGTLGGEPGQAKFSLVRAPKASVKKKTGRTENRTAPQDKR